MQLFKNKTVLTDWMVANLHEMLCGFWKVAIVRKQLFLSINIINSSDILLTKISHFFFFLYTNFIQALYCRWVARRHQSFWVSIQYWLRSFYYGKTFKIKPQILEGNNFLKGRLCICETNLLSIKFTKDSSKFNRF